MNGLDLVQRVYKRLRKPSQQSLPYQQVIDKVREVVTRKKLDLAISQQNHGAKMSDWFVPSAADFALDELGLDGGVLLPIRIETRSLDSEYETGDYVPIVDYEVLDTSIVGAASFYGEPMRISFRDVLPYVQNQQYRLVYESDFEDEITLDSIIGLPTFFGDMVVVEAAWGLLEENEDSSPEWMNFMKMVDMKWTAEIADNRQRWDRYIRMFKGRAQVPKRTFFENQRPRRRTRFFND